MHTNIRRLAVTAGALLLVVAITGCRYSGFVDANARTASAGGAGYLKSQQLADGSFEVAGFPGFETPDAVLAIADNAQAQSGWSVAQAKAAVDATTNGGHSALHALDDFADSGINAGQAAKLAILVARPLGSSTTSFDPDGDGAVNLQAIVDAGHQPDGSYGAFNATLYAAIAKRAFGGVPAEHARVHPGGAGGRRRLELRRRPDGGAGAGGHRHHRAGDPGPRLRPGRRDRRRSPRGCGVPRASQQANGAWQSFGADDPNSTAVAMIAITAAGFDPTVSCWRDVTAPALHGTAYTSPVTWLSGDQLPSGRFASPNDQFGVNTFATSQAVQALRRGWLPVEYLKVQTCP